MIIVTVEEAQAHLAELIEHVAAGEPVVIAVGGKSVARLVGPPMFPTTPEEVAATASRRLEFIRDYIRGCAEVGNPIPADHPIHRVAAGEDIP